MEYIHERHTKQFSHLPEKVLQFGEGNFLRAFVDWMIELSNKQGVFNGSVVICQPIEQGMCKQLNAQNCQYTVIMRGIEDGVPFEKMERVSSISRCINPYEDYQSLLDVARSNDLRVVVSNTTEAGIAYHPDDRLSDQPPVSYPAKLCVLLYTRFKAFLSDPQKGLLILPVELIDNNGAELKRIVYRYAQEWKLEAEFIHWLDASCEFASTLVDRIVTGYPHHQKEEFQAKLGYIDQMMVTCELFNLWVIEAADKWKDVFPIGTQPSHVIWTKDVTPYKKRKVRILNGAHTATVLAAYLAGHEIVSDFMKEGLFKNYMNSLLLDEVIPTIELPRDDLIAFANAVNDRFENPYIAHKLLDISLNSCSKINARCVPSLVDYLTLHHRPPKHLIFALAAFIRFYRGKWEEGKYLGQRENGSKFEIHDDNDLLEFFETVWQSNDYAHVAQMVLSNMDMWSGRDLTKLDGVLDAVASSLTSIMNHGIRTTMEGL